MEKDIFIIDCSNCEAKNRVKSYSADKIPVCAKCRTPLVDKDKNEVHAKYAKNLKNFYNLPDFGGRPPKS